MNPASPMRKIFGFPAAMAVVLILAFSGFSEKGFGAEQDRVGRFLTLILEAKSLDQISRAFERESFSPDETGRIESEIRKPSYRSQLERLKPKTQAGESGKLEIPRQTSEGKKAQIHPEPQPSGRSKPLSTKSVHGPGLSSKELQDITSHPGGGTEARISRMNPASGHAGQLLEIHGNDFGRSRGSVEILLFGRRYICDPVSWAPTMIQIRIPEYMEGILGGQSRKALLWVKLAGQSLGPTLEFRLEKPPEAINLPSRASQQVSEMAEMEISTYIELDGTTRLAHTETFEILSGQQLINGWKIVRSRLHRQSGTGTFEYIREPEVGTANLYQVIRLNTPAFSALRVASKMTLRGPKGTKCY